MSSLKSLQIVVLDDEKHICSIIKEALTGEPYRVKIFSNPKAGLEYIRNNHVDLVLSDLVMGKYSGLEVLDTTQAYHKDAVVILMTAHPTVETAISVLKKGAYDFMIKPFKLDILKATIKRGLDHLKVVRENLDLKGQIDFLRVAAAGVNGVEKDAFLDLLAESCRKELSADAVSVIEVDPDTREIINQVNSYDDEEMLVQLYRKGKNNYHEDELTDKPIIGKQTFLKDEETFIETVISQPIVIRDTMYGYINIYITSKFDELTPGNLDVLSLLCSSAASTLSNYKLYGNLQDSYLEAIVGLANAIEARDPYTAGHTDRVSLIAEYIAVKLGWNEQQIHNLKMGCTLHDIGKIGVPDSILNKPEALTEVEKARMNNHPQLGLWIIKDISLFKPAIPYIIAHHEWYNGEGYPNSLKGEEIPIEGRLLAVADTFDAIMSDRPYRKGCALEIALSELYKNKEIQFDPKLVNILIGIVKDGKIDFKTLYGRDEDITSFDQFLASEVDEDITSSNQSTQSEKAPV